MLILHLFLKSSVLQRCLWKNKDHLVLSSYWKSNSVLQNIMSCGFFAPLSEIWLLWPSLFAYLTYQILLVFFFFACFLGNMPWYSREQLLYGDCCLSEALFIYKWKALKGKELEFSKTSLLTKIAQGCVSHCCATPRCIYVFLSRSICVVMAYLVKLVYMLPFKAY